MKTINLDTDSIKLGQFLKLADIAMSGGDAKLIISNGEISVNGEVCTQRGKTLVDSDIVEFDGERFLIKTTVDR